MLPRPTSHHPALGPGTLTLGTRSRARTWLRTPTTKALEPCGLTLLQNQAENLRLSLALWSQAARAPPSPFQSLLRPPQQSSPGCSSPPAAQRPWLWTLAACPRRGQISTHSEALFTPCCSPLQALAHTQSLLQVPVCHRLLRPGAHVQGRRDDGLRYPRHGPSLLRSSAQLQQQLTWHHLQAATAPQSATSRSTASNR